MFAYSNSTIARNKSNEKTPKVSFCSRNSHNRPESYYNSCSIFNLVSKLSDVEQKRLVQRKAEESERREKLQQEQERRYKLCAEQERLVRERASQQLSLKQDQNRETLKRFYERNAREAKFQCPYGNISRSSSFSSINSNCSISSSFSSSSSRACPSSNNNSRQSSCRNLRHLVEKSKAALKINGFIIHHVRRQRTRCVLERLYKLREIESCLEMERQSVKITGLIEQLNNVQTGGSKIVCERKKIIFKAAKDILVKIAAEDDFVLVEAKEL